MTRLAYCSPAYPAAMTNFHSYDGTLLGCRRSGAGSPLVVVPGGPGRDADYLGDLGGLAAAAGRELVILDLRGTGGSREPDDLGTYRYDRMAGDVEALRLHLGAESIDLLAHSAGGGCAGRARGGGGAFLRPARAGGGGGWVCFLPAGPDPRAGVRRLVLVAP